MLERYLSWIVTLIPSVLDLKTYEHYVPEMVQSVVVMKTNSSHISDYTNGLTSMEYMRVFVKILFLFL